MILKPSNIIVVLFLICSLVLLVMAKQQSGVYDWPLKPGMIQWKELETHDEKLKVLQIPAEILSKMPTKDLALTCLNYPLFPDIWAFNSLQDGMERVISGFNGLQEFLQCKDAGVELFSIYKKMDPHRFEEGWSGLQKGQYTSEFAKIEILLAQDAILSALKQNERFLLLKEAVIKQRAMKQYPMFDKRNQEPNAYLLAKIIHKDNLILFNQVSQQKPELQTFLQRGSMVSTEIVDKIVSLAQHIMDN